ncbi:MAG: M6 family metalloprotease domain-containing protein [candidate division WOR-3 bacterium]
MNLLLAILFLMPPHPDIEKRMKEDGSWDNYLRIVEDARKRGLDSPSEELMEKTFKEVQEARKSKQKVVKRAAVILCDFPDYPATTPPARYDTLLSSTGVLPTGSVKEYYDEVSYGTLELQFVITPVWVRLPQTLTYYANNQYGLGSWPQNAQRMAYDAVLAADPYIDFSQCDMDGDGEIDALIIIHAGPGAESTGNTNHIWSHAWSIPVTLYVDGVRAFSYTTVPENAGCGVVSHELGHRPFGLPDLYDTDNSSEGIGNWCLMAGGSWNGSGNIPAHMSAWCKIRLGFVTVDTVRDNRILQAIPAVEDSPKVFRLWTNGNTGNRYFLVENRRLKKFDRALPGEGLLIFHVDDARPNNNNEWYPGQNYLYHYKVALEQADGRWDLEKKVNRGDAGDPWPGTTNNRDFHDYSVPDSKDYGNPMVTTYVGVLNISDPGDIMYADFTVSPYTNLKVTSISTPRADTLNANTEFVVRLFNNGFTQVNTEIQFKVYSESGDLIYSASQSNIVVDPGFADTISFTFQPVLDDHDYSYVFYNNYSDFSYRDDSLRGRLYSKSIERSYQVLRVEGGNYYEPHIVDGVVGDYEYYGANWHDISNFLAINGELNRTIRGVYMKAHIMNDTLFLGFKIYADSTLANNDYITFVFDDNGDGAFPSTNSNEGEITFRDGSTRLTYFRPYTSTGTGSSQTLNFPHAYSLVGGVKYAEVAIPIDLTGSGTASHLNIPGGYSNFQPRIFVKVTDGAKIIGWWPQNIAYATYVRDLPNFAVLTSSPLSVLENVHKSVRGMWKDNSFVVMYSGLTQKVHINVSIYDAAGRLIKNENTMIDGSGEKSFNFKGLPAGVYFVRLVLDGKESGIYKGVFVR